MDVSRPAMKFYKSSFGMSDSEAVAYYMARVQRKALGDDYRDDYLSAMKKRVQAAIGGSK